MVYRNLNIQKSHKTDSEYIVFVDKSGEDIITKIVFNRYKVVEDIFDYFRKIQISENEYTFIREESYSDALGKEASTVKSQIWTTDIELILDYIWKNIFKIYRSSKEYEKDEINIKHDYSSEDIERVDLISDSDSWMIWIGCIIIQK